MRMVKLTWSGLLVIAMIAALSITQCTESKGLNDQMTPGSEKNESTIQGPELTEAHLRAFTGVLALYGVEFDRIMAD